MLPSHSDVDQAQVSAQLGRPARGEWTVARRCHLGLPMVIESYPRLDGQPFPTLYWLTCPILAKRASALESEGFMTEVNERLARDEPLRARLAAAVGDLKDRRDRLEVLDPPPSPPGGGPDRVKCLHAHLAHGLVASNPVAALTLERTGWPDCRAGCVV